MNFHIPYIIMLKFKHYVIGVINYMLRNTPVIIIIVVIQIHELDPAALSLQAYRDGHTKYINQSINQYY